MMQPLVGVVMGSNSDWKVMSKAVELLEQFGVAHEYKVVSAHRTPDLLFEYASTAQSRGLQCIIAGAGGAAHLPGTTGLIQGMRERGYTVDPVIAVATKQREIELQEK